MLALRAQCSTPRPGRRMPLRAGVGAPDLTGRCCVAALQQRQSAAAWCRVCMHGRGACRGLDYMLPGAVQDAEAAQEGRLSLQLELPIFPQAVVYQQAATAPVPPPLAPAKALDLAGSLGGCSGLALQALADPEVPLLARPQLDVMPQQRERSRMPECAICSLHRPSCPVQQ